MQAVICLPVENLQYCFRGCGTMASFHHNSCCTGQQASRLNKVIIFRLATVDIEQDVTALGHNSRTDSVAMAVV
jgi:hypothetical protein